MSHPLLKSLFALVACVFSGICCAQDSVEDINFGNCGFAGSEIMISDYSCHQFQQRSDTGVKKEALMQLATMAWNLITGQSEEDNVDSFGRETASLNEGQKLEPTFRLDASGDEVLFTVAYEF